MQSVLTIITAIGEKSMSQSFSPIHLPSRVSYARNALPSTVVIILKHNFTATAVRANWISEAGSQAGRQAGSQAGWTTVTMYHDTASVGTRKPRARGKRGRGGEGRGCALPLGIANHNEKQHGNCINI